MTFSDGSLHQALCLSFQFKPCVLVDLAPSECRNALHKIEDALCGAADYAEQPVE
jgi:hypothetical protein